MYTQTWKQNKNVEEYVHSSKKENKQTNNEKDREREKTNNNNDATRAYLASKGN
jgi:hypothetical protein